MKIEIRKHYWWTWNVVTQRDSVQVIGTVHILHHQRAVQTGQHVLKCQHLQNNQYQISYFGEIPYDFESYDQISYT